MAKKTLSDLIERAKKAIEDHEEEAMDVAANTGQMIDNVGHMTWFIQAVAAEIGANVKAWQNVTVPDDWQML